jgi:hypothetical protein
MLWGARDSERVTQRKQTRNDVCSDEPVRPNDEASIERPRDAECVAESQRPGMQRNSFLHTDYVHGEIPFLIASSALLLSREMMSGYGWRQP